MDNLDNIAEIAKFDKGNVYGSIQALPRQVLQAWKEIKEIQIPDLYREVDNIVLSGMGGSALGGRVLHSLFLANLRIPFEVVTDYRLPGYVNHKSLVIISSYSGNTAETISSFNEALNKKGQIFVITTGGKLAEYAKEKNTPIYIYEPRENPSGQPRMALGYSITALLALFSKLGLIQTNDNDINSCITSMNRLAVLFDARYPESNNLAKMLSKKIKGKIPVIVASSHLLGIAHAFKNQVNENSKSFSLLFDIPELNHHLLEGLKNPALAKELYKFVFLESDIYDPDIFKRYKITQDVILKNEVGFEKYHLETITKLEQVFEILLLGSFVSFYLAMLYGIDPTPIPWVDYFKKELEK